MARENAPPVHCSLTWLLLTVTCAAVVVLYPIYGPDMPKPSRYSFFLYIAWLLPSFISNIFCFFLVIGSISRDDTMCEYMYRKSGTPPEKENLWGKATDVISGAVTLQSFWRTWWWLVWTKGFANPDDPPFDPSNTYDASGTVVVFLLMLLLSVPPFWFSSRTVVIILRRVGLLKYVNERKVDLELGERRGTGEESQLLSGSDEAKDSSGSIKLA